MFEQGESIGTGDWDILMSQGGEARGLVCEHTGSVDTGEGGCTWCSVVELAMILRIGSQVTESGKCL